LPWTTGVTAFCVYSVVNGTFQRSRPESAATPTSRLSVNVITCRVPAMSATTGEA